MELQTSELQNIHDISVIKESNLQSPLLQKSLKVYWTENKKGDRISSEAN